MFSNKRSSIIVPSALIIIALIVGYIIITNNSKNMEVDLSDIEQMNIGAEMPWLLYGDNNIAVIQGTFGIVLFNIQDSIVTNRISYEDIKPHGITMMMAAVSQDGGTIYIRNEDMYNESIFTHQYHINTGKIKKTTQQPTNLFKSVTIDVQGYNEEYDKYFDLQYLIGYMIVELDDSFIYLRSKDWNMKNLQILICQYGSGESKVFNIFKWKLSKINYYEIGGF